MHDEYPKIHNDDKIGDYEVTIMATKNIVNRFQCRSVADAREMAQLIIQKRRAKRLPVAAAFAQKIEAKGDRGLILSPNKVNLLM